MLYEVITSAIAAQIVGDLEDPGGEAPPCAVGWSRSRMRSHSVITSYRIHYTKLYEVRTDMGESGHGRYGMTVGRMLSASGIKAVVLDHDAEP